MLESTTNREMVNNLPFVIGTGYNSLDINSHGLLNKIETADKVCAFQDDKFLELIKENNLEIEGVNFKFTDTVWSFESMVPSTVVDTQLSNYKYNFQKLIVKTNDYYVTLVKLFLLNELLTNGIHRPTTKYYYYYICGFVIYLYKKNIFDLSEVHVNVLEEYFRSEYENTCINSTSIVKTSLYKLFEFYEMATNQQVSENIMLFLKKRNRTKQNAERKANKYKLIPYEYMKRLKDYIFNYSWSCPDTDSLHKRMAGALFLHLQTGIRPTEVLNLPKDCIETKTVNGLPAATMKYISTKDVYGKGYKVWHTYANAQMVQVYNKMVELIPNQATANRLLEGIQYSQYKKFFDHLCISNAEAFGGISYETPDDSFAAHIKKTDENGKTYYINYPHMKQFRVYISTELKQRGYSSFEITQLFGQSDPKMLDYYSRGISEHNDIGFSKSVIKDIISEDAAIIGPKGDLYTDKIRQFVKEGKARAMTIDQIVDDIAKELPVKEILGGCCITQGPHHPCELDNGLKADKLLCAYGLCPNQSHLYWNSAYHTELMHEMEAIVCHNAELGYTRQAEKELYKLQQIITTLLLPEMEQLDAQLAKESKEEICGKHPLMKNIIDNRFTIQQEAKKWQKITISKVLRASKN